MSEGEAVALIHKVMIGIIMIMILMIKMITIIMMILPCYSPQWHRRWRIARNCHPAGKSFDRLEIFAECQNIHKNGDK